MNRIEGREYGQIRPVKITTGYNKHAEGSVLIEAGDTRVICTATIEEKRPFFRRQESLGGWVTAEYGMLPRSTGVRMHREASRTGGRTLEIQRLIGRSMRAVVDMDALGDRTLLLDCDVIQADGGTRTASITGGFVAMVLALQKLVDQGLIANLPVKEYLAAVSVGKVDGVIMADLCFAEDSAAQVDMNVVMTGSGRFVEIQGTGEGSSFSRAEMDEMLDMAENGIKKLIDCQREALGAIAKKIGG